MSATFNQNFATLADIAKACIEQFPNCLLHYVGSVKPGISILCVKDTGMYLKDIRPYLEKNIDLCYGATQDTIHFYYV